ncbi:MAG: FtsX-like permease family protein [Verrucomicrobia bacterium]|nr:FtsX-like permease family protein [Verrucomicrobiota bacterium]
MTLNVPHTDIPSQKPISWTIALSVSWSSLKRRFFRSLITMSGVILAIAFLTYMLVTDNINRALVEANVDALNVLLQKAGIDILAGTGTDSRMILLISLALFTCLVGIINSMLMSVTERIKEIGTMKCLGALNTFILKIYFIESSLQGVIGTVLGMIFGLLVGILVSLRAYHGYALTYLPWERVGISLAISLVVGTLISIIAAIAPANWAATKEPVEAMRVEE